jgi:hypothetical protein
MSIPTEEEICWTNLDIPDSASRDERLETTSGKRERNWLVENRRLLAHRKKNCECSKCFREMEGLPPLETKEEEIASFRFKEREIRKAKKKAKTEVRDGKQATISSFFGRN